MNQYYLNRARKILKREGVAGLMKRSAKKLLKKSSIPDQNALYQDWIKTKEEPYLKNEYDSYMQRDFKFQNNPKISILTPVYNVDPKILEEAIDSVKAQWYENWELCLYDDGSTKKETTEYLKELEKKGTDKRIKIQLGKKNQNISIATNGAFSMSTGEYVMLMDNDDVLMPNALYEVIKVINENQQSKKGSLDLIYFDEDKLDKFNQRIEPFFKPDFSNELMWSMMYPTHAVYSRQIFKQAGKMRKGFEGSQDFDLALRVMELTNKIYHIPWVLYHWRKVKGSTADKISSKSYAIDAAKNSLREAMARRGFKGSIQNDFYPFMPIIEIKGKPSVEIIIPIKDKIELLKTCLDSIWENTTFANYKVTVVDNGSKEQETFKYIDSIKEKIKILKYPEEYNFAAINNFAAKKSKSDYVIFLNNDTKIITKDWIEGMLMWAQQKGIGAVGCKLLYQDRSVQHAGVVLGVGGVANHAYYRMPEENNFYFNQLHCVRNYLAVTGACMMVSRAKFNGLGGFNEELPLAYNDVDLCLKLYKKGMRNVYTPYVELIHYESKSRDPHVSIEEDNYMKDKWRQFIKEDPYYNSNLNKDLEKGPMFSL